MTHQYDLTILNCAITVDNLFSKELKRPFGNSILLKDKLRSDILGASLGFGTVEILDLHYYELLHQLVIKLSNESNIELKKFNKNYLSDLNFFSEEELANIPEKPNNSNYNQLLKKYHFSFLHNDIVLSFENEYEILINNDEELYFQFLILMLCDYGIKHINKILEHHVKKVPDMGYFINQLEIQLVAMPKILKDEDILNVINKWISNIPKLKEEKIPAPVIALFCSLLNDSKIDKRIDGEKIEDFCIKICKKYSLNYTDRVRQTYSDRPNKENIKNLKKMILSEVDGNINLKILEYLNTL